MGDRVITIRVGGRRSGKTTKIIEWLAENPDGIVVCATQMEAHRLYNKAIEQKLDVNALQFRSADENLRGLKGKIAIDEAQWLLQRMYPNIDFVTMTGELDGHST